MLYSGINFRNAHKSEFPPGYNSLLTTLPSYWIVLYIFFFFFGCEVAGDQPQLIQGIRSGDGVGEDQETIA